MGYPCQDGRSLPSSTPGFHEEKVRSMSTAGVSGGRRRFLTATASVVGGVGLGFTAVPFISAWQPSERTRAIGAPVQINVSKLEPGQLITVLWRGKPVWVVRRTLESLDALSALDPILRDPDSEVTGQQPEYARNQHRSLKPEYLVLVGICTHLGCSPQYVVAAGADRYNLGGDWPGGFFCPCHGSKFDLAGRVYPGVPAPTNLEVPPHRYLDGDRIEIGVDHGAEESLS